MQITFIIADYYGHQFTGSVSKRSVKITLTDEQVKAIKLRHVGTKYSDTHKKQIDVFEDYHDVFIDQPQHP